MRFRGTAAAIALGLGALAAGLGGCSDGAGAGAPSDRGSTPGATAPTATTPARPAPPLTPAQLAGQRVVFAFAGTVPPAGLVRRIRRGEAGGVILFGGNITSTGQARAMIARLQAIPRPPGLRQPLLVMVDQEGGPVERVPVGQPSAASLGRSGDPAAARAAGRAAGQAVAWVGGNVDLAPVADVGRPGSALEGEGRVFGRDPVRVARLAGVFADAVRREGVAAAAKHFPGLGAAPRNTDFGRVTIRLPLATLRDVDARPFRALIEAGVALVMLSTATYPALDSRPAAFSSRIAVSELRGRLGFRGVTITDALDTPALDGFGGPQERVLRAVRVGVDLVILTGGYDSGDRAALALERDLRAGRLQAATFRRSAQRVLSLRASLD